MIGRDDQRFIQGAADTLAARIATLEAALRGVASCSTCECCRNVARRVLDGDLAGPGQSTPDEEQ